MAGKTVNELDAASVPLVGTDKILVSRDGINVNRASVSDLAPSIIVVASSRTLVSTDNGNTLDCTASGIDLTLPTGLTNFGCAVIKNGTTRIVPATGVLLNGVNSAVTITATVGAIVPTSVANSYKVVGV